MYGRISNFLASIITICVLPLLPIFVELFVKQEVAVSSLVITSVIYGISMTITSGDKLLFLLAIIWSIFGSISFMMSMQQDNNMIPLNIIFPSCAMIAVCFFFHSYQRVQEHLVRGRPFEFFGG